MQPDELVDGEFEIRLYRGEVDALGSRARYGEVTVIVWHRHDYAGSWLTRG